MYNYYQSKPVVTLEDGDFVVHFHTYRDGFPVNHHLVLGNRVAARSFASSLVDGVRELDAKLPPL